MKPAIQERVHRYERGAEGEHFSGRRLGRLLLQGRPQPTTGRSSGSLVTSIFRVKKGTTKAGKDLVGFKRDVERMRCCRPFVGHSAAGRPAVLAVGRRGGRHSGERHLLAMRGVTNTAFREDGSPAASKALPLPRDLLLSHPFLDVGEAVDDL